MACVPTPTSTRFSTGSSTSMSSSVYVSNEVNTITSPVIVTSVRCEAYNTSASGTPCISSTIASSTSYTAVVTTTPHTSVTGVPIIVQQVVPIETLYQQCPDNPNTPTSEPADDTTSTTPRPRPTETVIVTTQGNNTITITTTTSSESSLSPSNQPPKSNSNLPAIIGGTVGGILAILGIIGLIWYLLWRREQNKFLFDDDEDDHDAHPNTGMLANDGRKKRRSVNLEQEIKEARPYQYGVVGGSPSPSASPLPHSQYSSFGGYSHRRDTSRDRLMSSPPGSPGRLDVPLSDRQRRTSHYSSGVPESIMMTTQTSNVNTRTSDDGRGHERAASASLMDSANVYPPGHGGFYQQYGPIEPAQSPVGSSTSPSSPPPLNNGMHKPPLEPQLIPATRPIPAHQALVAAAGLLGPLPPIPSTTSGHATVMASPPPGAAGARPYQERREQGDMLSAVMSSGDQAAASATATQINANVGFGRQMRPEKSPRMETVRSPVIQHQDGGRVPENVSTAAPATEEPPAYSQ